MSDRGGSEDPREDEQYHLEVTGGDVADSVLLPGDPGRIETITDCWDDAEVVADHREYRTATGTHEQTPISVTSTGIQPETDVGDLIVTSGAVRQEGTSDEYIRSDYPAVADHAVVAALAAAAEDLGYDYHVGLTASTDSFYAGQSREGFGGYTSQASEAMIEELKAANVLNFEMEASAILALANIYGLRGGAVCTVYADRTTGEFEVTGEQRAAKTASRAVTLLAEMDERVAEADTSEWHAKLGLD